MIRVFGVANHSPEAVIRALVKSKRASVSDIGILPVDYTLNLKKSTPHKFLIVLSVPDLIRNLPVISSAKYAECHAIVFANPMKLSELHGIQPLDFAPNPEYVGFGFTLKMLDIGKIKSFKGVPAIEKHPGKYLAKLVQHVQQGSLLNPFMTFIYTLPSVMQGPTKTAALKWLYSGKSEAQLDKAFDEIDQGTITKRVKLKFREILINDVGHAFQEAFKEYRTRKEGTSVKHIAKAHSVSEYEMHYILSVIESAKKSDNYTDSFDKAKNRKRA